MFAPQAALSVIFLALAAWQDAKSREVSDFLWVMSIPTLLVLLVLDGNYLLAIPGAVLVAASAVLAKIGFMGQADPLAISVAVLGFSFEMSSLPAYFFPFVLSLACELAVFAYMTWGKESKGAPASFTYLVPRSKIGMFWFPRLENGELAFDINDPRPLDQLLKEAQQRLSGDVVWATPVLPYLPFLAASCLVFFVIALL